MLERRQTDDEFINYLFFPILIRVIQFGVLGFAFAFSLKFKPFFQDQCLNAAQSASKPPTEEETIFSPGT